VRSSESLRTCLVTRQVLPPEAMIRFVLSPQGEIVADLKRRLPGRGVWISANAEAVRQAVRRQAFARHFKPSPGGLEALAERVDRLIEADALQSLAIANKAGLVVAGSVKVEAAIAAQSLAGLVHASDGGADGIRKIRQALVRRFGEAAVAVPAINSFASAQLDLALGRTNVIHAALIEGPASRALLARVRRLETYRGAGPAGAAGEGVALESLLAKTGLPAHETDPEPGS